MKSATRTYCNPPGRPPSIAKTIFGAMLLCIAASTPADSVARPAEGDYPMPGGTLASGSVIPELMFHYRTLGMPTYDATGLITDAVLLLRGAAPGASRTVPV